MRQVKGYDLINKEELIGLLRDCASSCGGSQIDETQKLFDDFLQRRGLQSKRPFISMEPVTVNQLVCTHPQVHKSWEWGGYAPSLTSSKPSRTISIVLHSGERADFEDDGNGDALIMAEDYLKSLPL